LGIQPFILLFFVGGVAATILLALFGNIPCAQIESGKMLKAGARYDLGFTASVD